MGNRKVKSCVALQIQNKNCERSSQRQLCFQLVLVELETIASNWSLVFEQTILLYVVFLVKFAIVRVSHILRQLNLFFVRLNKSNCNPRLVQYELQVFGHF